MVKHLIHSFPMHLFSTPFLSIPSPSRLDSNYPQLVFKNFKIIANKVIVIVFIKRNTLQSCTTLQSNLENCRCWKNVTYIITQTLQNKRNNEKTKKETSFWLICFVGSLQKQIITHKFLETFNRNIFKLSYSCKQNLNILMTSHNKKATSYSKTNIILNIRPVSTYPKNL